MPRSSYLIVLIIFAEEYIQGDSKLLSGFPWPFIMKLVIAILSSLLLLPLSGAQIFSSTLCPQTPSVYFGLEVLTAVLM
jgi:hypothetical protein